MRGREGGVRERDWREGRGIIGGEGLGLEQRYRLDEREGWDTGPESVGFRFRTESALGLKRTGGGSKKKASDWQAAER